MRREVVMSITEANSKIYGPKTYNEAINNSIHGRYWREAIEQKLQNLENYQSWEYEELLPGRKVISLK